MALSGWTVRSRAVPVIPRSDPLADLSLGGSHTAKRLAQVLRSGMGRRAVHLSATSVIGRLIARSGCGAHPADRRHPSAVDETPESTDGGAAHEAVPTE